MAGNTNWGGRLSTVDLFIKVACFVKKKENNIFNLKMSCGLYYKPDDDSRAVNKLETSLTDDTRVIINNSHMFKVQATDLN